MTADTSGSTEQGVALQGLSPAAGIKVGDAVTYRALFGGGDWLATVTLVRPGPLFDIDIPVASSIVSLRGIKFGPGLGQLTCR